MPKILNPTLDYKCFLCESQANYISFNSKKLRCTEKITQCPGFILKAEESRSTNMSKLDRRNHMKLMSNKGNAKLKTLHKDSKWRNNKGANISNAKVKNGSAIDPSKKSDWQLYEDTVDRITRSSWIYNNVLINPTGLIRGKDYELDHKYSKQQGFINGIPAEYIGHYTNLHLVQQSINRQKYNTCSITKEELYALVYATMPSDSPSSETTTS